MIVHQGLRARLPVRNSNLTRYLGSAAVVTFIGRTMTTEPVPPPDSRGPHLGIGVPSVCALSLGMLRRGGSLATLELAAQGAH